MKFNPRQAALSPFTSPLCKLVLETLEIVYHKMSLTYMNCFALLYRHYFFAAPEDRQ